MGIKSSSSSKDFNRVLAHQPRTSVSITKFEAPRNLQQQPLTTSFSIPAPARISQAKNRIESTAATLPNVLPVINEHFEPTPTVTQSNPSPVIEAKKLPVVNTNHTQQKSDEQQPQQQQQIIEPSTSEPVRSDLLALHQTMNGDAVVISRSVMDFNDPRWIGNHHSSSVQPFRTVIERNGKQFVVEFKERTERRYVQYIDETTHQMRYFEVVDCIPCRIIQPYRRTTETLSQNDTSQNTVLPTHWSSQRYVLPSISHDGSDQSPSLPSYSNNQRSALPPISNDRSNQSSPPPSYSDNRSNQPPPLPPYPNNRSNQQHILPSRPSNRSSQRSAYAPILSDRSNQYRTLPSIPYDRSNQRIVLPSIPYDRSNQRTVLPSILNGRSERVTPSDPIDNRRSSEYNVKGKKVNVSFKNNTPQNLRYISSTALPSQQSEPMPRLSTQSTVDPKYYHSRYSQSSSSSIKSSSIGPESVSNEYPSEFFFEQSPSFRAHTPTIADDSTSSSSSATAVSLDSDEETERDDNETIDRMLRSNKSLNGYGHMSSSFFSDRKNSALSYEILGDYQSPMSLDPFARSVNPTDRHHYRKRPTIQNYAEPVINNRRFRQSVQDYAPIPVAFKQPIQNQYSHRNDVRQSVDDR